MKEKLHLLLILCAILISTEKQIVAQTTLSAGDVVILEFNGNGTDGFSFMPLVNLQAGTKINFTDYGWNGTAIWTAEEGTTIPPGGQGNMITYTAPSAITAGTLIRQNTANVGGTAFTEDLDFSSYNWNHSNYIGALNSLNSGHDGILVFQGSASNPTFIWAYHTGQWGQGSYANYYWSDLPTGLTNRTNAVYFPDLSSGTDLTVDDGYYSGDKTAADAATWRSRVADKANWTTSASGTAPTLLYPTTYTVNSSDVAPTVTTQAVSSIAATTATGNGNITALGSPNPTAYGVCWSTSANPTITNSKADNGTASATGAFTANMTSLTTNTTYYVRAFATNTAGTSYGEEVTFTTLTTGTFTGASGTDWNTVGNWAGGSVPTSTTDVTIPSGKTVVIGSTTSASCKNLTNSGNLTIESSGAGTGSLIISGTTTASASCQRYMTGSIWHLIAPTAVGGSVSTFIQSAGNAVATSGSNYGMMNYDETTNVWNSYFTSAVSRNFTAGEGYAIRRSADGVVTFLGTLNSGTQTVSVAKNGGGWNLIGNPYTSSIYMNTAANAIANFLKTNAIDASKLDPGYACIYLWDVTSETYKILGNSSYAGRNLDINVFAPGQAFFVKAAAGTVEFNKDMQVNQTNSTFKAPATNVSWPGITLIASDETTTSSADIAFNANMSKGLDPTFDAGLLRGTNGLSLYTRLLEDNGVDFAIQCLPEEYDHLVIPVGIDYSSGGKITFSAETSGLPQDCKLVLEDKSTQTYTSLLAGESYSITLPEATFGTGRFYLHVGSKVTSFNTPDVATGSLKVYTDEGAIIIEGEVNSQAIATLYDMQGQKLSIEQLQKGIMNKISCPKSSGVYLLTIQQNGKAVTRKLINK